MKKTMFILLLSLGSVSFLTAQTKLTIIGCAHESTKGMNADSLFVILSEIKPDVILLELDTTLIDGNGKFKGRAVGAGGNEMVASRYYKKQNNEVILRGFDIANRSAYYDANNTFAMEAQVSKSIDDLYKHKLLDADCTKIIAAEYSANQILNSLLEMSIYVLNSKPFMNLASFREYWIYNKTLEVVAHTPQLKQYYAFQKEDGDFWKVRNQAMISNIINYLEAFNGKNIVVLTGAMHTYALNEGLQPLQEKMNFKLTDLPTQVFTIP